MTENAMVRAADINVDDIGRIGKMLAMSGYFEGDRDINKAVAQMAVKVMAGREMGFGPFASANGIHIIKGKPSIGSNLMASAVKGHPRYNYRVRENSATVCRIEFFERADSGEWESIGVSEFTEADARAAGTQNMQKFARNMLFARAMSNGVRWFCPDVFNGNAVYVPEELGATVDGDGNVIDAGYTVHKTQNGNGNAAPGLVDMAEGDYTSAVDFDMAEVTEDTAGALVTPQPNAAMFNIPANEFSDSTSKFIAYLRQLHEDSDKKMTAKQYGYMISLIDDVVGDGMHGAVLSVALGYEVSSDEVPGFGVKAVIDWLKNEDGKFAESQGKAKTALGEIAAKCRELAA